MSRLAVLSSIALACGCGPSSIVGSRLGEVMVLRVGEVAEVGEAGLRVGFTAVRDDSRCPPPETGVACVWQGTATVVGWAERPRQPRSEIVLATTDAPGRSTVARYSAYEIELLALSPPRIGETRPSEYVLTLVVRRAEPAAAPAP